MEADVVIVPCPADGPEAAALFAHLDAELVERYPDAAEHGFAPEDVQGGRGFFLIARIDGIAVGWIRQPEALRLCESAGYTRIPAFGEYRGDPYSVCFEKALDLALPPARW